MEEKTIINHIIRMWNCDIICNVRYMTITIGNILKSLGKGERKTMRKSLVIIFIVMVASLTSCRGYNDCGPQGPGGWGPMMHYGFGYGGMFMWIIFLIVIGLLIYFIVQAQKTKSKTASKNESPLDILQRRYARGDIAREEYERMKKDLEG
jgi:putative membrane protein